MDGQTARIRGSGNNGGAMWCHGWPVEASFFFSRPPLLRPESVSFIQRLTKLSPTVSCCCRFLHPSAYFFTLLLKREGLEMRPSPAPFKLLTEMRKTITIRKEGRKRERTLAEPRQDACVCGRLERLRACARARVVCAGKRERENFGINKNTPRLSCQ